MKKTDTCNKKVKQLKTNKQEQFNNKDLTMRTKCNIVSSFMFYMWNEWNEIECKHIFTQDSRHFWRKWTEACQKGVMEAAERFFAELSEWNRELLVNRACELYNANRRNRKKK